MRAGHTEDNRVLGDNGVIGEAISAHDTAVTIKPHNRTIALDHGRASLERGMPGVTGFAVGSPSSTCPNTSSNAPEPTYG